jgi:hypothetical protein
VRQFSDEARVGAEIGARDLAPVACNDGLERIAPAIGPVHVAGTQRAALQVAELVEYE